MRAPEDKCGRDMPQESAPEESDSQKILAAAPSNESYLTIDTCAGGSVFPRGFDPIAESDERYIIGTSAPYDSQRRPSGQVSLRL